VRLDLAGALQAKGAMTLEFRFRRAFAAAAGDRTEHLAVLGNPLLAAATGVFGAGQAGPRLWLMSGVATPPNLCYEAPRAQTSVYPDVGTWHHLAIELEAAPADGSPRRVRMFVDGAEQPEGTSADELCPDPNMLYLCRGATPTSNSQRSFQGLIDDVRVSDVVRYDANFTPALYGTDADTVALLRFETEPLVDEGPHRFTLAIEGAPARVPVP
jgi:hypothetical protein